MKKGGFTLSSILYISSKLNIAERAWDICFVYSNDAIAEGTAQGWPVKFKGDVHDNHPNLMKELKNKRRWSDIDFREYLSDFYNTWHPTKIFVKNQCYCRYCRNFYFINNMIEIRNIILKGIN